MNRNEICGIGEAELFSRKKQAAIEPPEIECPVTYAQYSRAAIARLMEKGLSYGEAHERVRLLLDGATGTRYAHLLKPEAELEPSQLAKLHTWIEKSVGGCPIPYILGRASFFGLDFRVDERVLIPRPETELLVEVALKNIKPLVSPRLADIGTGSGAIAVSLAKNRRDAQVWAMDISAGALEVARQNALANDVSVHFLQGEGDWLAPLPTDEPFDAILSNPPYIPARDIEGLEIGVREFEPRLALDGGADGLNPYRALAEGAGKQLKRDGFLAVELGMGQFGDIRALFESKGWQVELPFLDLAGIERVLVARPMVQRF